MTKQETIFVDKNIFNQDVVIAAGVKFIDTFFITLKNKAKQIEVNFEFKSNNSSNKRKELKKEFLNELIFQKVRANISKQNQEIRELIVSKAIIGADPEFAKGYAKLMSDDSDLPNNPLDALDI